MFLVVFVIFNFRCDLTYFMTHYKMLILVSKKFRPIISPTVQHDCDYGI